MTPTPQIEVDFKAECYAGDTLDNLYKVLEPEENSAPAGTTRVLHSLRRRTEGGATQEILRCRTTWVAP